RRPSVGSEDAARDRGPRLERDLDVVDVLSLGDLDALELRLLPAGADGGQGDLSRLLVVVDEPAFVVGDGAVSPDHLAGLSAQSPAGRAGEVDLGTRDRLLVGTDHASGDLRGGM